MRSKQTAKRAVGGAGLGAVIAEWLETPDWELRLGQ
jgi:hypothetical protein